MAVRFGFLSLIVALGSLTGCGSDSAPPAQPPQERVVTKSPPETETKTEPEVETQPAKEEAPKGDTREAFIADAKAIFADLAKHVSGIKDEAAAEVAANKIKAMRPRFVGFQERALTHGFLTPDDWAKAAGDGKEQPEVADLIDEYKKSNPKIAQKLELAIMTAMTGVEPGRLQMKFTEAEHIWTRLLGIATAVSTDGKLMATVSIDLNAVQPDTEEGTEPVKIAVWDTTTGTRLREWKDNHQSSSLAITNDGKKLVSVGTADKKDEVRLWSLADGEQRFVTPLIEMSSRGYLTISAEDSTAYLMSSPTGYFVVDLATGAVTRLVEDDRGTIVVAPRTEMVIRPTMDQLEIFNSPQDFASDKMPATALPSIPQAANITCSANGRFVAVTYNKPAGEKETAMLAVYDMESQKIAMDQPSGLSADPFAVQLEQVAITHDGNTVVIFNNNLNGKTLEIFDVPTQKRTSTDASNWDVIVGFTPAGVLITSVSYRYQFFDLKTKSRIMPPLGAEHFHLKPREK